LARHAGHREVVTKAQALSICKVSVFFGAQVLRGREARKDENGEQSSGSSRRTTAVLLSCLTRNQFHIEFCDTSRNKE